MSVSSTSGLGIPARKNDQIATSRKGDKSTREASPSLSHSLNATSPPSPSSSSSWSNCRNWPSTVWLVLAIWSITRVINSISLYGIFDTYLYVLAERSDKGEANTFVGMAESVNGLTSLAMVVPCALWLDTFSRRALLRFASVVGTLSCAIFAYGILHDELWGIYTGLALWAVQAQVGYSVGEALMADAVPAGERSLMSGIKTIFGQIAFTIGPLLEIVLFYFLGDKWSMNTLHIVLVTGVVFWPVVIVCCWALPAAPLSVKDASSAGVSKDIMERALRKNKKKQHPQQHPQQQQRLVGDSSDCNSCSVGDVRRRRKVPSEFHNSIEAAKEQKDEENRKYLHRYSSRQFSVFTFKLRTFLARCPCCRRRLRRYRSTGSIHRSLRDQQADLRVPLVDDDEDDVCGSYQGGAAGSTSSYNRHQRYQGGALEPVGRIVNIAQHQTLQHQPQSQDERSMTTAASHLWQSCRWSKGEKIHPHHKRRDDGAISSFPAPTKPPIFSHHRNDINRCNHQEADDDDVVIDDDLAACHALEQPNSEATSLPWWTIPAFITAVEWMLAIGAGMTVKFLPLVFMNDYHLPPMIVCCILAGQQFSQALFTRAGQMVSMTSIGRPGTAAVLLLAGSLTLFCMTRPCPLALFLILFLVRAGIQNARAPLDRSIVMDYTPRKTRARWSSLLSVTRFTWSGSAVLGGWIADRKDYRYTFSITATIYLIAFILYIPTVWLVPPRERPPRQVVHEAARNFQALRRKRAGDGLGSPADSASSFSVGSTQYRVTSSSSHIP